MKCLVGNPILLYACYATLQSNQQTMVVLLEETYASAKMLCLNSTKAKPLLFPVCLFLGRWHSLTGPNFSKSCLRAEISENPWKIAINSQQMWPSWYCFLAVAEKQQSEEPKALLVDKLAAISLKEQCCIVSSKISCQVNRVLSTEQSYTGRAQRQAMPDQVHVSDAQACCHKNCVTATGTYIKHV